MRRAGIRRRVEEILFSLDISVDTKGWGRDRRIASRSDPSVSLNPGTWVQFFSGLIEECRGRRYLGTGEHRVQGAHTSTRSFPCTPPIDASRALCTLRGGSRPNSQLADGRHNAEALCAGDKAVLKKEHDLAVRQSTCVFEIQAEQENATVRVVTCGIRYRFGDGGPDNDIRRARQSSLWRAAGANVTILTTLYFDIPAFA